MMRKMVINLAEDDTKYVPSDFIATATTDFYFENDTEMNEPSAMENSFDMMSARSAGKGMEKMNNISKGKGKGGAMSNGKGKGMVQGKGAGKGKGGGKGKGAGKGKGVGKGKGGNRGKGMQKTKKSKAGMKLPGMKCPPTSVPTLRPTLSPGSTTMPAPSVPAGPTLAPGTVAPAGPTDPFPPDAIQVRVRDYFLAYVIPNLTVQPTPEQTAALITITETFWDAYFKEKYPRSPQRYIGIQIIPNEVRYRAGIPEQKFNFYIDFNTTVAFEGGSTNLPATQALFDVMAQANFQSYILNYVRRVNIDPNPFRSNNEVIFRASERIVSLQFNESVDQSSGLQGVGFVGDEIENDSTVHVHNHVFTPIQKDRLGAPRPAHGETQRNADFLHT